MHMVFSDEEWRVFYERIEKVRNDLENEFQDREYNLYEEMTKKYNQLYSCNLSVDKFKIALRQLNNNCYEVEE